MGFLIIIILLFTWGYQAHNMYKYGCVSRFASQGICGQDGKTIFLIMTVACIAVVILLVREQAQKRRKKNSREE